VPRELALIAISLACLLVQWYSYGGSWKLVTILPILIGILKQLLFAICFCIPSYVHQQRFHLIIKILYIQLSGVFLPILGTHLVQGFILKGDLQFLKFLKKTVHWKTFHLFYPPPFSPLVCPHTEFKGSPEDANWNVLYHTSLRNYAAISLQVPSILSILLGRDDLYRFVQIKVHWKTFHPSYPLHFLPLFVPLTEFKGRPEAATWNVLYHTSFRNYAAIILQVPSILSILLDAPHEGNISGWEWTVLSSVDTVSDY
jgi:hypothetical protein